MTKILVIEDEIGIRDNVVDILELEGFETLAAQDGQLGIELAMKQLPDLILCDIMMPDIDGYQVLMEVRDNLATAMIPFVFLTAKADRPSVRYGMELGADDYLTKPFTASGLVAAITTRLEKQQVMTQRYTQMLEDLRGNNIFNILPHELRTPLVAILGYAELLMWDTDTLSPQRISEMAERIFTSGKRLHHLVENFLVYAQIQIIRADPDRLTALRDHYVNRPDKLITQIAFDKAQQANREADLQIIVTEEHTLQISLESLKKIIEELVDNAFKFSDPGTPVQITAEVVEQMYQWTITNNGRGMTSEQIANIGAGMQFERLLYEQQGAGLGLVIAQQLVELHSGTLEIESELDTETVVHVRLPLG